MKLIYFGSSDFSCTILQILCERGFSPALVVTQPDKPKGRGLKVLPTEVSLFAVKKNLPSVKPVSLKKEDIGTYLASFAPDVFVVADYGKILPLSLLHIPKTLPIAIHPSLLPRYRGPAPINWALINGDKVTGVTIFKMDQTLDSGEILLQKTIPVGLRDDATSLHALLAHEGGLLAIEALKMIEDGRVILKAQDESAVTFARKLTKEDGKINWGLSAQKIKNAIRGTVGWPSMHIRYQGKIIKILDVESASEHSEFPPATVIRSDKEGIYVATIEGVLQIKKIQPEGKRAMDAWAYVLGHHVKVGDRFE